MNTSEKEYLRSLIPEQRTDYHQLLQEGKELGQSFTVNPSA